MNPSLILQDIGIVLGIEQQDPSFFNLDFLQYTGIIPSEWQLTRTPTRSTQSAQVNFQNGVSLIAQPTQTLFLEALNERPLDSIEAPQIALRFSEIMKNMNFQSINLNFRGYSEFPGSEQAAHQYFFNKLLAPGPWHQLGIAPVRAGLDLVYTFENKRLDLRVQESAIQQLDETTISALVFTGSFETIVKSEAPKDKLLEVQATIQNWQSDLKLFIDVVSRFFMQPKAPPVPEGPIPLG